MEMVTSEELAKLGHLNAEVLSGRTLRMLPLVDQ
jgi:hypothetical protein